MNKWKERGRRRTEHTVWRDRGKIWPIYGTESRISDALTGFAASAHILSVKAPFQRRQQILNNSHDHPRVRRPQARAGFPAWGPEAEQLSGI